MRHAVTSSCGKRQMSHCKPVKRIFAGTSAALQWWMSQKILRFMCAGVVLCAFGCSRQKLEESAKSVEISIHSGDAPVAGAPVKMIDGPGAVDAILPLASREDFTGGIPESLYGDFFKALKPVSVTETITSDHDG